ncbi:MAG: cytochrome d ubiquinol oxidase subunit II [Muribaculaceae bacterium]|nr:cytochrome d ubiquinol oxidase subunit II [Muribaculaceae bacterium]
METLEILQAYWWLLISVLGGVLVFLLFVQGGQSMLYSGDNESDRQLMVNSLGRKWEFTYTTLVVFGGAFFAAFPLFYSTSFGGAYWLWMLILLSFVIQAFSYEFRRKQGNIYGTRFYDGCLLCNGFLGCVLLGVAVGLFFFGGPFTVNRANLLDPSSPVISQWSSAPALQSVLTLKTMLLGVTVFFLARTLGSLYFVNNIDGGAEFGARMRRRTLWNGLIFAVLFVTFTVVLMLAPGYRADAAGHFVAEDCIYFHNITGMWWLSVVFVAGVVAVLYGIGRTAFDRKWRSGIWYAGAGTVAVVIVLFSIAGYGGTAYLPSTTDAQSSLTIANSSSTLFTLKVMSVVSVLIPFVIGYIWYVWRKMNATPLTSQELNEESHTY